MTVLVEPTNARLIQVPSGQRLRLDPATTTGGSSLEILEGIARLHCPCLDGDGITLAFLRHHDRLDGPHRFGEALGLEAITPLLLRANPPPGGEARVDPVLQWMRLLLRIRHLPGAEERLLALLALLAERLGHRCGDGITLPFHLTHERMSEVIGTTRGTTTRMLSRLRSQGLLQVRRGEPHLRLSDTLLASIPPLD